MKEGQPSHHDHEDLSGMGERAHVHLDDLIQNFHERLATVRELTQRHRREGAEIITRIPDPRDKEKKKTIELSTESIHSIKPAKKDGHVSFKHNGKLYIISAAALIGAAAGFRLRQKYKDK